jgi:hypothetical protein
MTDDMRRDRQVHDWIQADAPAQAPDRLRDAVRAELAQTRQEAASPVFVRRATLVSGWGAAAAVVVVGLAFVGAGLVGNRGSIATPLPSPTLVSTPSSSPSVASPRPTPGGSLLPAGPFSTSAFTPGLRFTAPAGWVLGEDRPDTLYLNPADAGVLRQADAALVFDGLAVYSEPVAGPPDGGPTALAGVGTTAKDLATWLSARPQLVSSRPVQVTLAGRTAWQLDFRLSAEAGVMCGMPCVNLLNSANGAYQFGIEGPWRVRAVLVDAPDGTTVLITVNDVDGVGTATELRQAQPILDSMTFVP